MLGEVRGSERRCNVSRGFVLEYRTFLFKVDHVRTVVCLDKVGNEGFRTL